jgi:carbamoyl-phosphate synthase small subunit
MRHGVSPAALLALEDGTLWPGRGFGAAVEVEGEIVFNTSLSGYQEILTDPSYCGQLVTMTATQIGNTGVNPLDVESGRIWATALVVRDLSPVVSSWRASGDLARWLAEQGIPGVTGVETRALVRHIREQGAMRAALSSTDPDPDRLVAKARAAREVTGLDLVREVSCHQRYVWGEAARWWSPQVQSSQRSSPEAGAEGAIGDRGNHPPPRGPCATPGLFHVVAYDFGIKRNILRLLAGRGCRVTVVPASTSAAEALALDPDGVFLSNGPGDPAAVTYAIENVRALLGQKPIFGICLGHQILALALGARTYKLKFGHRGANQPVRTPAGGPVEISAHNHGFAVAANTLPAGTVITLANLNDDCCEGLAAPALHAFSVQYHPESSPGPHDSDHHFDAFVNLMAAASGIAVSKATGSKMESTSWTGRTSTDSQAPGSSMSGHA